MSITLKSNSIEVYDGTAQKNKINIFEENNTENMSSVISSIQTIQNSISDIATIRAGAAKGATAVQSLSGYATESWVRNNYQPKGNYLTSHQSLVNYLPYSSVAVGRVFVGALSSNSSQAIVATCSYNRTLSGIPIVVATPYQTNATDLSGALSVQVYAIGTSSCSIRCKTHDNPSAQNVWVNIFAIY